jgi:hypothetical protein
MKIQNNSPEDKPYQLIDGEINVEFDIEVDGETRVGVKPLLECREAMDMYGNLLNVPIQCGAVRNNKPEAQIYERKILIEVVTGGYIFKRDCPYTRQYSTTIFGDDHDDVQLATGGKDCGGKSDGCDHWHAVRAKRLAFAKKKHEELNKKEATFSQRDLAEMAKVFRDVNTGGKPAKEE